MGHREKISQYGAFNTAYRRELKNNLQKKGCLTHDYGWESIYDSKLNTPEKANDYIQSTSLTELEQTAVAFFRYGQEISECDANTLFSGNPKVLEQLIDLGVVATEIRGNESVYRLNDLSLESLRLPNGEEMYLFIDLPLEFRQGKQIATPTAHLSATSFTLLRHLFKQEAPLKGLVADFGSGTGIQGIALLMQNPGIENMFFMEIDGRSMNLNKLNAMLNGVADRSTVVDNLDTGAFARALNGRLLSEAVFNPPFNIVPKELSAAFTDFGDGGEHGLDITGLFFQQALPHMQKGGEIILYSQLAEGGDGKFFLEHLLDKDYKGLEVHYNPNGPNFENLEYDRKMYAEILYDFSITRPDFIAATQTPISAATIEASLARSDVAFLRPNYVHVTATGTQEPNLYNASLKKADFDALMSKGDPCYGGGECSRPILGGGVYERREESLLNPPKGGVYIRHERVIDLDALTKALKKRNK